MKVIFCHNPTELLRAANFEIHVFSEQRVDLHYFHLFDPALVSEWNREFLKRIFIMFPHHPESLSFEEVLVLHVFISGWDHSSQ